MIGEVVYLWLIDGIDVAFASSTSFTAAMADDFERTVVHYGLQLPSGLQASIDLIKGVLEDTTVSITVDDVDGTLAALFAQSFDSALDLVSNLDAATNPAPAYLWGKHVGVEKIGAAGERRQHSCVPGWNVGLQHYGQNESLVYGIGAAPYGDYPVLWPGRKCTLYRLVRQPNTTFAAERIWWGSLLGQGEVEARSWTFKCAGPESWISGNLGLGNRKEPIQVSAEVSFEEGDESTLVASLYILNLETYEYFYTYDTEYTNATYLLTATSYDDVAQAMNDFLDDFRSALGVGDEVQFFFSTSPGDYGMKVQWRRPDDPNDDPAENFLTLVLRIRTHIKVWQTLGYDVYQQNSERHPVENENEYGQFWDAGDQLLWSGNFFAAAPVAMAAVEGYDGYDFIEGNDELPPTNEDCYNNGFWRAWPPLARGGGQYWDMESGGQEFIVNTFDPLYLIPSQSKWFLESPTDPTNAYQISNGVGEVTRQGLYVFEGPYRPRGGTDNGQKDSNEKYLKEGKTKQVARVCWREAADGTVSTDNDGYPRLVIHEWLDPRLVGVDYPKLTGSWGGWREPPDDGMPTTMLPIVVFESSAYREASDNIEHVIHNVWLTTGTGAGWTGTADSPVLDVGDNAVYGYANDLTPDFYDFETSIYGLGVPLEMVGSKKHLRNSLGENALLKCKAAFVGPISARTLYQSLLSPSGGMISMAGGKYSLFDPWVFQTFEDLDEGVILISPDDYAGPPDDPGSMFPAQSQRIGSPIDVLKVEARVDPTNGNFYLKYDERSYDRGSNSRRQTIEQKIQGNHLIHPLLAGVDGSAWRPDFTVRWRQGTNFWAHQHFEVQLTLQASIGLQLWPGQAVVLSDPWITNPGEGKYGLDFGAGYVTGRSFDCRSEQMEVTLLISSQPVRMYAPALAVTRYDEDDEAEGYRLYVEDHLYRSNPAAIGWGSNRNIGLSGFQPPEWYAPDNVDTDIEIFQFDGYSWTRGIYGVVSSITYDNSLAVINQYNPRGWLNLTGPLTGNTYYRDMHHIVVLRDAANQTAEWVQELYAPICDDDGTYDGGTPGKKWI